MTAPDISVIIAAWKSQGCLTRAVRSALDSRDVTVEVIVVDDASPDGTLGVAQALAASDPRIIVAGLGVNSGPSAARNEGLSMARGRFAAILDADDAMLPDRLCRMIRRADATGADIVVDNMTEVSASGERLNAHNFLRSPAFAADREIDLATWISFNTPMQAGDCLGYLKPLIRLSALPGDRRVYDATLRNGEDYYLIAGLLAENNRMLYLASPGYLYTRSQGSTSFRLKPEHTRAWIEQEKRFAETISARLNAAAMKASACRLRRLRHVHQFVSATAFLKAARPDRALSLLASDLRGGSYAIGLFARIAAGKLLGRRLV